MSNEEGKIYYGIGLDNSQLLVDARKTKSIFEGVGDKSVAQAARIDNSYKRIGNTLALLGAGVGLGSMVKELYTFANAFDKSMKEVSTLSTTVTNDLDGFKKSILDMTTEIPVGADGAAKALYQIVSAGHDGADGLRVLEIAAKAAIGGVTDTVTAADAITTLLNAYKLDASEANSISDQLFTTVRLGKTTFGELGNSIAQVAPIAASFGVGTQEMLAAVATLTQSGTPTAQAMTQIRASIVDTSKVLGDGYYQTHSFQEGLNEIALRANGSESELRKLIPSIEATTGILGLTGINAQAAAAHLDELGRSFGATESAATKMSNTTDAQITMLENKMLAKFHSIGDGAVDMVGSVATFLNSDGVFSKTALDDLIATMGVLIVTVGAYKAQLIVTNAINTVQQNSRYTAEIIELQRLIGVKEVAKNQDLQKLVDNKKLTADQMAKIALLRLEVNEKLSAMQLDAKKAAQELINAKLIHKENLKKAIISKTLVKQREMELSLAKLSGNATRIELAEKSLLEAQEKRHTDVKVRKSSATTIALAQSRATTTALATETLQQSINTASTTAGTKAKGLFAIATTRVSKAFKLLGAAIKANPLGLLLTALSLVTSAMVFFKKETEDVADATETLKTKTQELISAIEDLGSSEYFRLKSFEELQKLYPGVLKNMSIDNFLTKDRVAIQKELNEATEKATFATQDAELATARKELTGLKKSLKDKIDKGASNIGRGYRKEIEDQKNLITELEGVIKKRNDLFTKANTAPVPLGKQISSLDEQIKLEEAKQKELSKLLFDIEAKNERDRQAGKPLLLDLNFPGAELKATDKRLKLLREKKTAIENQQVEIDKIKGIGADNTQTKNLRADNAQYIIDAQRELFDRELELYEDNAMAKLTVLQDIADFEYNLKIESIAKLESLAKTEKGYDKSVFDQARADAKNDKNLSYSDADTGFQQRLGEELATVKQNTSNKLKTKQDELDAILDKYKTFEQQKADITTKYDAERKKVLDSTETADVKIATTSNINKAEEKEISAVDSTEYQSLQKDGGVIAKLFEDTSSKSIKEINIIRDKTQELLSYLANTPTSDIVDMPDLGMSAEQLKHLQGSADELDKIKQSSDRLHTEGVKKNPFGQMSKDLETLFDNSDDSANLESKLKNLGESAGVSADLIGGLAGGLSNMFAAAGSDKMAGLAQGVEMAMTSVSNVASGFASGGIAGGIAAAAGELLNYATMAFEAEAAHQAALEAINQTRVAQQKEYNSLLREQNLLYEEGSTVFGDDTYGKATNAIKQSKLDTEALKKQMAEIAQVQVVTGHKKTGLFGWGKGKDTYSSVLDVYKDLIDAEGNLEVERAKSILATENMSDAHRQAIEDGIELTENYKESVSEMNDYLGSIFGDLGSSMSDALVDAFRNGTDAGEAFETSMVSMLERLAQDFAYSMAIAPILTDAQKEIEKINDSGLSEKDRSLALQNVALETGKNLANAEKDYFAYLQAMKDGASASGTDIFTPDEDTREASAKKGIATASQESVDENNGRLTAIQGHTYEILQVLKQMFDKEEPVNGNTEDYNKFSTIANSGDYKPRSLDQILQSSPLNFTGKFAVNENAELAKVFMGALEVRQPVSSGSNSSASNMAEAQSFSLYTKQIIENNARMLEHLAGIETNTAYCRHLEMIDQNISSMRNDIGDMNFRGLRLRK